MDKWAYVSRMELELSDKIRHNKKSIGKIAQEFGITDKNLVKELTELAIVKQARKLAGMYSTISERFKAIVELYNNQANLSHRTSQSILLQQYSTPCAIGYLLGVFCLMDQPGFYFEPSAGNGMLTVAGKPSDFLVNEIDDIRFGNLAQQGFFKLTKQDATKPFPETYYQDKNFDGVITNPPFGKLPTAKKVDGFTIADLDHWMVINALGTMKDSGRFACIIGGHTTWDDLGRIQAGKNRSFFSYLYKNYNVLDVINIDGHKLYSRQGTSFDTRIILIDGRKEKAEGVPPLKQPSDYVVTSFDDLYNRVMKFVPQKSGFEFELKLLELELELI